jgi:hypothetical protein
MSFNALIAVLALVAVIGMTVVLRQLIQLAIVLAENRRSFPDRPRPDIHSK